MRLLLVEDEDDVVQAVMAAVTADVVVAASRDEAYDVLDKDRSFDLIVCDLMIPPFAGAGLAKSTEHGFAVHERCRTTVPSIPIRFYSGKATLDNMTDVLSANEQVDLFGEGSRRPMIYVHQKNRPMKFVDEVAEMSAALTALDAALEVSVAGPISDMAKRAVGIIGRRAGATRAEVRTPGSAAAGLSGAETLGVLYHDDADALRGRYFLKVADHQRIASELHSFQTYVPTLLTDGFTPLSEVLMHGLRDRASISYTLADGFDRSLMQLAAQDSSLALTALARLREDIEPWRSVREQTPTKIVDLRGAGVDDATVVGADGWSELNERYEASTVDVPFSVAHGDLHGGNVLVRTDGEPILIDFGDVGIHPVGRDPVTLELSVIFHPSSPLIGSGWPTVDLCRDYFQSGTFFADSPLRDFLVVVRDWAVEATRSLDLHAGLVYAHAMRQLKYPNTDHDLARALAEAAMRATL